MGQDRSDRPIAVVKAEDLALVVRCEGADHRLSAVGSSLVLDAHQDLDAELAMVALGGAEPICIARYRLWADALADGGFLAEWVDETRMSPTWFSWLAMALERMRAEGFHEFLRRLPPARAQRMGEFLHHFPPAWIDRAAALVSSAVFDGDGVVCRDAEALLVTATANRVRRAFVDAVGGRQLAVGAAALVPLKIISLNDTGLNDTAPNDTAVAPAASGCLRGAERGVRVAVAPTWLHRVWAVGAAVIGGRLVLALDQADVTPMATVVSWELQSVGGHRPFIERVPVRFEDGGWIDA